MNSYGEYRGLNKNKNILTLKYVLGFLNIAKIQYR